MPIGEGWQAVPEPVGPRMGFLLIKCKVRREEKPQMKQADYADWKAGRPRPNQFVPQRSFVL
jgi:hypothetical protein